LNLLIGLSSENLGLRTSSAQMLGDMLSQKAVFPLMSMLKGDEHEEARIVAALALSKIGSPVGIFAVKQATRFDESERVRKMCSNFYNAIVSVSYDDLLFIASN
jgi:HEAT repeat protein